MKKASVIFLVIVVTLAYSIYAQSQIDSEIKELFDGREEANVIVVLKDDYGILQNYGVSKYKDDFEMKKLMINAQQGYVFQSLNLKGKKPDDYDFELTNTYSTINGFAGKLKKSSYSKLKNNPKVERIVKSKTLKLFLNESAPLIEAPNVWKLVYGDNITGKGETVCVIDTGIDYTHPSLGGCTRNSFLSGKCNKVLAGFDFVNDDNDPIDDGGHGTHVAGIIASTDSKYRGVAPDATLVAVKSCTSFACNSEDVIAGIDWCINNAEKYNISVISMSLGGGLFETHCDDEPTEIIFKIPIDTAVSRGIAVVAAAGNFGDPFAIASPACIRNAIAVGSSTKDDKMSDFSNRNSITDLLAPGTSIKSTVPTSNCPFCEPSGFNVLSGTSMATPHVSGAITLLRQFKRLQEGIILNPLQIQYALNFTGKQIDDTAESGLFFSRINVLAALKFLNTTIPNIPLPEPPSLKKPGLLIVKVDAKVDGKKSNNIADDSKIRRDAHPESKIILKVTVKNDFPESQDTKIENIEVIARIEGVDEDSDLEEESNEFDLKAQDEKTVTLKFALPLNVDEDDFNVEVEAEGEDEDGVVYKQDFKTELEIEKEKHDLRLLKFELTPKTISCNRELFISHKIMNLGEKDESNAIFEIKNNDFGLEFVQKDISINSGTEDNEFSKFLRFKINDDIGEGSYPVTANVYSSDGKLLDTNTKEIKVEDCVKKTDARDEEVVLIFGSTSSDNQYSIKASKEETKETGKNIKIVSKEKNNIALLLFSSLVFTIFFVFMAIIMFLRFYNNHFPCSINLLILCTKSSAIL